MNPDQAIDRVLTALATTEAPPNMENRVLTTLQTRAAADRHSSSPLSSFFTPWTRHPERSAKREVEGPRARSSHPYLSNLSVTPFRAWAIAAGLIILSLAASLAVRRRHDPTQGNTVLKQFTPSGAIPAPQIASAQKEREPHTFLPSALPPRKSSAPAEDINDLDAMAIIEMNAPSKPAPPLPLSHQELLLAGAAQQADRPELSSLRPEVRAREMELSKAEFHDFFEPPPAAKDNE